MPKKNSDLAAEIGHRIYKCRKDKGWKQQELADRADLSLQFLACVERGTKGLGFESIIKVGQALETSTDYLLTGAASPAELNYVQALFDALDETQREIAIEIIEKVLLICGQKLPKL